MLPEEIPSPADTATGLGQVIKANLRGEKALTAEPVYQGEPVVAVAAVDELTAIEAIELIEIDWEPLPFNVDPIDSLRPGTPTARLEGNAWIRPAAAPGQPHLLRPHLGDKSPPAVRPTISSVRGLGADQTGGLTNRTCSTAKPMRCIGFGE